LQTGELLGSELLRMKFPSLVAAIAIGLMSPPLFAVTATLQEAANFGNQQATGVAGLQKRPHLREFPRLVGSSTRSRWRRL
jgi:hypothetical protein